MEVKVYVGTYAKYNNGNISGKWVDLCDYSDLEDFLDECRDIHDDEDDPEFMFQDTDCHNVFSDFISESSIDESIFDVIDKLHDYDLDDDGDIIALFNEACDDLSYHDDRIYSMDELDEVLEGMSKEDVFRLGCYSDINWSDDYFVFNGYGNIETISDVSNHVDWSIINEYLTK